MLPVDFCQRMEEMLGDDYQAFLNSYDEHKKQSLRVNTLKGSVDEFLNQSTFELQKVPWNSAGFYYGQEDFPGKHAYHEAGVYYIQEASAMTPAVYLEAEPGERVLDLCAAPGGKTTQIAASMKGEGLLICNEIHPARAKILSENVERMGIGNALVVNETPQSLHKAFPNFFHKIMVDAPCSGEGMFRKQEDATEEWSLANVRMCGERQDEILEEAYGMLLPGGRMVYSTCTFSPDENEGSISRFLYAHPDMHIVMVPLFEGMERGRVDWLERFTDASVPAAANLESTIRLFPHKLSGEGHFLAVLEKDGPKGEIESASYKLEKTISFKELPELAQFAKDNLSAQMLDALEQGKFVKFGDQVYLVPENLPKLKGIKVLRAGLHLGEMKKNRFEPSHSLALYLSKHLVQRSFDLTSKEQTIYRYLAGETFMVEEEQQGNGWYLITVDGYSIGWGKLTGATMKNHYPKGLRKIIKRNL